MCPISLWSSFARIRRVPPTLVKGICHQHKPLCRRVGLDKPLVVENKWLQSTRRWSSNHQHKPLVRRSSAIGVYWDMNEGEECLLVDIRSPEEYSRFHIIGSLNLPLDSVPQKLPEYIDDPDRRVVVLTEAALCLEKEIDSTFEPIAEKGTYVTVVEGGIQALKEVGFMYYQDMDLVEGHTQ